MNVYLYKGSDLRICQTDEEFQTLSRKGYRIREDPPTTDEFHYPDWNHQTQQWEIKERPVIIGEWSSLDFLLRLTFDERTELALQARTNPLVSDFRLLCASSGSVRANHPLTVQGLNYIQQLGIITEERKNQILDPYWTP